MNEIATRPAAPARSGALSGIRVVELGFAAAGPLVGSTSRTSGAEVIRLESRLAADVFRTTYPPFKDGIVTPDRAAMFSFYNYGQARATINLKDPRGVALARELIGKADLFVESFTPARSTARPLGAETLTPEHPGLIVYRAAIRPDRAHAFHPGYGSQLSALAGFVQLLGEPESTPSFSMARTSTTSRSATARSPFLRASSGGGVPPRLHDRPLAYEAGLQFLKPTILEFAATGESLVVAGNADACRGGHMRVSVRGSRSVGRPEHLDRRRVDAFRA